MKLQVLLRQIHHWGSLLIMLQVGVIIGAGLLLMLKKELDWIQPPTQKGSGEYQMPGVSLVEMFTAVQGVPQAEISSWRDLSRVDVKPDKGIVKFVGKNNWEVQVDARNAAVLQTAYRRSDIIESIHDGSYFTSWTKLYVFLPTGVVLFILWLTGIYLFALPLVKRMRKRRKRRSASAATKVQAAE